MSTTITEQIMKEHTVICIDRSMFLQVHRPTMNRKQHMCFGKLEAKHGRVNNMEGEYASIVEENVYIDLFNWVRCHR